jgi:hypothetical protein
MTDGKSRIDRTNEQASYPEKAKQISQHAKDPRMLRKVLFIKVVVSRAKKPSSSAVACILHIHIHPLSLYKVLKTQNRIPGPKIKTPFMQYTNHLSALQVFKTSKHSFPSPAPP